MEKDLITDLKDAWFKEAAEADALDKGKRWKPRFECMKSIYQVLNGSEETNVEVKVDITDNKKAKDFMKIMVNWLSDENHVFTRIAIVRLMPKLIDAFDKKLLKGFESKLLETILEVQWMDKKAMFLVHVTPVLLKLWAKVGVLCSALLCDPCACFVCNRPDSSSKARNSKTGSSRLSGIAARRPASQPATSWPRSR